MKIKGIYLFDTDIDIEEFFRFCRNCAINFVFTIEYFYLNKRFKKMADEYEIKICLNFPVYFDKEYLDKKPECYSIDWRGNKAIADWLHFVCPSQTDFLIYQKRKIKDLLEVQNPAMICFDFIRFFVYWEKIYSGVNLQDIVDGCYCEKCLNSFQDYLGMINNKDAQWIKKNLSEEWASWKCGVIQNTVAELTNTVKTANETILTGLYSVPWQEQDFNGAIRSVAGQDIRLLKKYVDVFIPMTYSEMLKRGPRWIHHVVNEVHAMTGKQVLSSFEVAAARVGDEMSESEFIKIFNLASKDPSAGVILFQYDSVLHTSKNIRELLYSV